MTRREVQLRCDLCSLIWNFVPNDGDDSFIYESMLGSWRDVARHLISWSPESWDDVKEYWKRWIVPKLAEIAAEQ